MNANPYSPPSEPAPSKSDRFRPLFVAASWLTATLSALFVVMAVYMGYTNFTFATQTGGTLPLYIPLVTLVILGCAAGLAYSSVKWRRRQLRAALLSLLGVLILFFVGPRLLLMILYGQ